ncbi:MAG: response regulator [Nitrospirae bacterium]|nr:response regulator [Candidatus Manganitrophaceae bacterium]
MKRILVIENDPFILMLLNDMLTRIGYCVTQTESGISGLEKIEREEFDAIILDIHLRDIDGRLVYEKVKTRSSSLASRVLFMTGDVGNPDTVSFIRKTGNLWLEKPFTVPQLKDILKRLFLEKES